MSIKFTDAGIGTGTVTNVSSANGDITVSSPTAAPVLTLNSATTATASKIAKRDTNGDLAGNVLGNAATVTTNANLTGDVTSVGNATTLTNAPVIAKVLTGYVSGAGTIASTDSILQAIQKLNGNDATNANLTGPITSTGNATAIAAGAIDITKIAGYSSTGTPVGVVTPVAAGQVFIDQNNGLTYISTSNTNTSWVVVTQYYGMSQQAVKNSNLERWSRGTSISNPAHLQYTAERYIVTSSMDGGTFPTLVHSQLALTSGDLFNSYYAYRINADGAGSSFGVNSVYSVNHRIEFGVRSLAGASKKVTFSIYARSSISNKRMGVTLFQNYGSGGSPTSQETVTGQIVTLTSTLTKYTFTFTTNTLVGKTFGTNNDDYLMVRISFLWGTTQATTLFGGGTAESFVGAGNIDFTQLKLGAGDVDSPFQPIDPGMEAYNTQRYVIPYTDANTTFPIGNGFALSTTQARIHVELPQNMRIAPSLVATATDWQLSDGVTATDLTAISIVSGQSSNKTVTLLCTVASGLTQFRPYQLIADGTANRLMIFDAEL